MIPVVIDTNVFLSALLFGGTPGKLISGDSHLLALKSYGKASILTPLQFQKKFQEELKNGQ